MALIAPAPARPGPAADDLATAAVSVRGVQHTYRAREGLSPAIERLDLEVATGEFVAILGPSGCGKSTLLRIVAGLLAPTAGLVKLDGEESGQARRRRAIGWLAQDDGLFPWRTVAANVALPLQLRRDGLAPPDAAAEILAAVGLRGSAGRYPHELSGGMRQRAALARALVARPRFLLLDEPFAHVDSLTRERLGGLLLDLRAATWPTTLLVTHDAAEAVRLADRAIVLSGRPARLLADLPLSLPQPRRDDQPGFGACVRQIKEILAAGSAAWSEEG